MVGAKSSTNRVDDFKKGSHKKTRERTRAEEGRR